MLLLFQNLLETGDQALTTASPISSTVLYTPAITAAGDLILASPISSTTLYEPSLAITIVLPVISSTTISTPFVFIPGTATTPDVELEFNLNMAVSVIFKV